MWSPFGPPPPLQQLWQCGLLSHPHVIASLPCPVYQQDQTQHRLHSRSRRRSRRRNHSSRHRRSRSRSGRRRRRRSRGGRRRRQSSSSSISRIDYHRRCMHQNIVELDHHRAQLREWLSKLRARLSQPQLPKQVRLRNRAPTPDGPWSTPEAPPTTILSNGALEPTEISSSSTNNGESESVEDSTCSHDGRLAPQHRLHSRSRRRRHRRSRSSRRRRSFSCSGRRHRRQSRSDSRRRQNSSSSISRIDYHRRCIHYIAQLRARLSQLRERLSKPQQTQQVRPRSRAPTPDGPRSTPEAPPSLYTLINGVLEPIEISSSPIKNDYSEPGVDSTCSHDDHLMTQLRTRLSQLQTRLSQP